MEEKAQTSMKRVLPVVIPDVVEENLSITFTFCGLHYYSSLKPEPFGAPLSLGSDGACTKKHDR